MSGHSKIDLTIQAAWDRTISFVAHPTGRLQPFLIGIAAAYIEGSRHYHTLHHVLQCLDTLKEYPKPIPYHSEIELALWYHYAIYDPQKRDNEEQSGRLLKQDLEKADLPTSSIQKAYELVIATDHKRPANDEAEAIIADVDMAILSYPQEQYTTYSEQIRKEYSCFDDNTFSEGRKTFLKHFLAKQSIYQTPFYHSQFEAKARTNMERELKQLSQ